MRAHTKASSSCGSCTPLVEGLLTLALGDGYTAPAGEKALCTCTALGHDTVRREIVAQGLKTIPEAMQALGWGTEDGCHVCRPALNYYMLCAWPGEYVDSAQSRFVNERMHANIQKDGTFSVVPRMWGGLTNSRELRAIADVVDKFARGGCYKIQVRGLIPLPFDPSTGDPPGKDDVSTAPADEGDYAIGITFAELDMDTHVLTDDGNDVLEPKLFFGLYLDTNPADGGGDDGKGRDLYALVAFRLWSCGGGAGGGLGGGA